jgi:hypothetical protein
MKRTIIGIVGVVCGLAVAASAATPAKKSTKAGKSLTLTGCLQAGGSAGTFKLTSVTGGPAATNKVWELMGAPSSLNMADHVGHKVAVTGTIMGTGHAKKAEGEQSARGESSERTCRCSRSSTSPQPVRSGAIPFEGGLRQGPALASRWDSVPSPQDPPEPLRRSPGRASPARILELTRIPPRR